MIDLSNEPVAEPGSPFTSDALVRPVPPHLRDALAPATWIVEEWREYWHSHDVDHHVTIGSVGVGQSPAGSGHTRIRFENQLGLATIRVRDAAGTEIARHHVEVIAGKFGSVDESVAFLRHTLTALYSHIASTPFVLGASTERSVRESPVPPTPLFTFHFFRRHAGEVVRAVQAVLGQPHQRLDADPVLVRPHEVRHVDPETLTLMLRAGHSSPVPVGSGTRLPALKRLRPERVWQRIPAETFDTPENRFVLAVCRRMIAALNGLTAQGWYQAVAPDVRDRIGEAGEHLTMLTRDDRFASLGPPVVTPAQSRVLQRKDGYRDLNMLWQRFQRSREPLFERMQAAIDLRSVDQLYELWVLFELIARIGEITREEPVLTQVVDTFGVPVGGYRARFGGHGTLTYNARASTYSGLSLRPDYLWQAVGNAPAVALDAKFRMRQPKVLIEGEGGEAEWVATDGPATATTDDLTKMHAYRDAIRHVRAAVVLYPGETTVFRSLDGAKRELSLREVLEGDWEGIGAIALAPHGVVARSDPDGDIDS